MVLVNIRWDHLVNRLLEKVINVIGEETKIEGHIYSSRPIQINGLVVGEIIAKKKITVGNKGEVLGNIKTKNIELEGKFKGNLVASGKIKILSTGAFIGNMISKGYKFFVVEGGLFKGKKISVENEEIFKKDGIEEIKDLKIKVKKIYNTKDLSESKIILRKPSNHKKIS